MCCCDCIAPSHQAEAADWVHICIPCISMYDCHSADFGHQEATNGVAQRVALNLPLIQMGGGGSMCVTASFDIDTNF